MCVWSSPAWSSVPTVISTLPSSENLRTVCETVSMIHKPPLLSKRMVWGFLNIPCPQDLTSLPSGEYTCTGILPRLKVHTLPSGATATLDIAAVHSPPAGGLSEGQFASTLYPDALSIRG